MKKNEDSPQVRVYPPVIFLSALASGWILNYFLPYPFIPFSLRLSGGLTLLALGGLLTAWSMFAFHKAKTAIDPRQPTTFLILSGPFRYTRNPLYVTLFLMLTGFGVLLDNPWMLAGLLPMYLALRYAVVALEEEYLERKFGEEYRKYKASVRRWL